MLLVVKIYKNTKHADHIEISKKLYRATVNVTAPHLKCISCLLSNSAVVSRVGGGTFKDIMRRFDEYRREIS